MKQSHVNRNQSVVNANSPKNRSGSATFQFVDNRSEAIIQRKLQKMATEQFKDPIQKQEVEEEELLQGKFKPIQKQEIEEELLQGKLEPIQKKENNTGLPDNLKARIENLSGYSMDDVKVHRGSDKPRQLQAHAYAQGTNIHLGLGQEKYLPHEAWHVVQQKQGRVKPTMQMKGKLNVNDDKELEKEADVMGRKALQRKKNNTNSIGTSSGNQKKNNAVISIKQQTSSIVQRVPIDYTLTEGIDHPAIYAGGVRLVFDTSNGNEARKYLDLMITSYRITKEGKYLISQAIRRSAGANNIAIADRLRLSAWFDDRYGIKMEDIARGGLFEPEKGPEL